MRGALLRYRIMAWITGVALIILCFVGLPLKYAADSDGVVAVVDGAAVSEGRFADDPEKLLAQRAQDSAVDHDNPLEEVYELNRR